MATDAEIAIFNTILGMIVLFLIITYVLISIFLGMIFKKADTPAWKAWVPIYNTAVTLQLGGQKGWIAWFTIIPGLNIVASIFLYIAMYNIGLRLEKDGTFILWALFLPVVWYIWLATDDSTWHHLPSNTNYTDDSSIL